MLLVRKPARLSTVYWNKECPLHRYRREQISRIAWRFYWTRNRNTSQFAGRDYLAPLVDLINADAGKDIDIIIGYGTDGTPGEVYLAAGNFVEEAPEVFGRPVEAIHMMNREVETDLLLEALLTSASVYSSEDWPTQNIAQARDYLDEGYRRPKTAYELLEQVNMQLQHTTKDVCTFIHLEELMILYIFLQTRSSATGSLIQHCIDIANEVDFPTTHPFPNGLFGPIISWVSGERDLLQRIKAENLDKSELERAWKLLTVDFRKYAELLGLDF